MRFIATIAIETQVSRHETNINLSHVHIESPSLEAATGLAYLVAERLFGGKIKCIVTPLDSLGVVTRAEDARLAKDTKQ